MPNAGTEVITVNECLNTNDENDTFIGDCGITMQRIMGLASEAARCCRDYIFENTPFNTVYSYMTADNDEFTDTDGKRLKAYAITRAEWNALRT